MLRAAPATVPMQQPRLEDLLEQNRGFLQSYVSTRLGHALRSHEPVTDVVQSAMREMLAHPGNFSYQGPEAFRAFLMRAVEHKIANKRRYLRAQKRMGSNLEQVDLDHVASVAPDPTGSEVAMQRESLERLANALDQLDPADRELITMRRIAGCSPAVIAEQLGVSESTVRRRVAQIMLRLGHLLNSGCDQDP